MTLFEIIVIALLQIFFLPIIFIRLKKKTASVFDLLFILTLDCGLTVFLIFPNLFGIIASFFGIARGIDIFIYFAIIALFYISFRIYFKMEKLKQEITKLNRELSLREAKKSDPQ